MFQKIKKGYQVVAAIILMLVVSIGYIFANQKAELSKQLNEKVSARTLSENVVISGVKEVSKTGSAMSSVGPSYNNQVATFESNFVAPNDQMVYQITYKNVGSKDCLLTEVSFTPDASDIDFMTYAIGNVKENETIVGAGKVLKVYVYATVKETATALVSPTKRFEVKLTFEQK